MIVLRPLTDTDLPVLRPWFDDPETRRWLGGYTWPSGKLAMADTGRHTVLASLDDVPIGLVDVETYNDQRAAFAIVVAPALRGRGTGSAIVAACLADPPFAEITEWLAGVESGNLASRQLLLACGFTRVTDQDANGFSYFARRRGGWPDLPWQVPWAAAGPHSRRSPARKQPMKTSAADVAQ